MATNVTKLKGKGAPPVLDTPIDPIASNVRANDGEQRPLQVRIPTSVFEEFSEQAAKEFGYSHGAKKQLFLKMWEAYRMKS